MKKAQIMAKVKELLVIRTTFDESCFGIFNLKLTGSRAWGVESDSSDYDIMIRADGLNLQELFPESEKSNYNNGIKLQVFDVEVNLIPLVGFEYYCWEKATDALVLLSEDKAIRNGLKDRLTRLAVFEATRANVKMIMASNEIGKKITGGKFNG
jgi:hypothetical protein